MGRLGTQHILHIRPLALYELRQLAEIDKVKTPHSPGICVKTALI